MKEAALWKFILEHLEEGKPVALLAVLQSEGSSPGRAGFKMALSVSGEMCGSIGGGIMEHKLVETARKKLQDENSSPILKKQIHSKKAVQNQSGMICSGEQTVVLYLLKPDIPTAINSILKAFEKQASGFLILNQNGITFTEKLPADKTSGFFQENDSVWLYSEAIPFREKVYIIGAGHVSLALSKILAFLNFEIYLFDDRPELNTFQENAFASEKTIVSYPEVDRYILENPEAYVVIMTFGYRTDGIVLRQLLGKKFKYLGLMGSEAKIKQLFSELQAEGFPKEELENVYAPIGVPIKSKTPEEIAISIAAQIIKIKNA